jgi:hypothetical protein
MLRSAAEQAALGGEDERTDDSEEERQGNVAVEEGEEKENDKE